MAKTEDLKRTWQSQSGISQERFDQIGTKVSDSSELLQTTIFRRDMRDALGSIVVIAVFTLFLFTAKNWIGRSGYAIIVIACIIIPLVLWWARKRPLATVSAANFRDFINIEIDYLRRQVQLLRLVAWWGLLPMYVGLVFTLVGLAGLPDSMSDVVFLTVILAICAGVFVYIWWLNQVARKAHLEPLLDYYIKMRTALDSGDEFLMQLPDPPSAFLLPGPPRKPMSRRRRWVWVTLTVAATVLVLAAGYATTQHFDPRTGKFIASCAPVVAILMVFISGIWRRNPVATTELKSDA